MSFNSRSSCCRTLFATSSSPSFFESNCAKRASRFATLLSELESLRAIDIDYLFQRCPLLFRQETVQFRVLNWRSGVFDLLRHLCFKRGFDVGRQICIVQIGLFLKSKRTIKLSKIIELNCIRTMKCLRFSSFDCLNAANFSSISASIFCWNEAASCSPPSFGFCLNCSNKILNLENRFRSKVFMPMPYLFDGLILSFLVDSLELRFTDTLTIVEQRLHCANIKVHTVFVQYQIVRFGRCLFHWRSKINQSELIYRS